MPWPLPPLYFFWNMPVFFVICPLEFFSGHLIWKLVKHFIFHNLAHTMPWLLPPLYFSKYAQRNFFSHPFESWQNISYFLTTYYAVATTTAVFFVICPLEFYRSPIWELAKHFIFLNYILCRGHYHHCIFRNMPSGIFSVTHLKVGKTFHIS